MVRRVRRLLVDWFGGPIRKVLRLAQWQQAAFANLDKAPPIYPAHSSSSIRVHLGAGEINLQGWININARAFAHIHAQTTSLALAEFADGAVSAIYICHVLEHLSFAEGRALLLALHHKLADGGALIIAVPDFDALVTAYLGAERNFDAIKFPLMGGQGYEYNFHRAMYTRGSLASLLTECGYANPEPWQTKAEFGTDLGDWSSATIQAGASGAIPLSLNLKAMKLVG